MFANKSHSRLDASHETMVHWWVSDLYSLQRLYKQIFKELTNRFVSLVPTQLHELIGSSQRAII